MKAVLLDYSPFGNEHDRRSDLILMGAMKKQGIFAHQELISPCRFPRIKEDLVWFRYDVRSPVDLHWVVEKARKLEKAGHAVFPSSEIIRVAEDKWETWLAFKNRGVKTPPTFLGNELERCPYPAIIKRRVGWGGMGNEKVFKNEDIKPVLAHLNEFFICQPYIPHRRTIIVSVAGTRGITCIENMRGDPTIDGDVRVIEYPGNALRLAPVLIEEQWTEGEMMTFREIHQREKQSRTRCALQSAHYFE